MIKSLSPSSSFSSEHPFEYSNAPIEGFLFDLSHPKKSSFTIVDDALPVLYKLNQSS